MLKLNRVLRNFVILALLVTGVLSTPFTMENAHAQSDCVDPATGQQCTPTPEPPTCSSDPASANYCTPVPQQQPADKPKPTRTSPPPTLAPTFTFTPAATNTLTVTSTITASPSATLTATATRAVSTTTPVPEVLQVPFSTPKTVTPKSNNGFWGGVTEWFNNLINRFFPDKHTSVVVNDLLWLTKVNVVDASQYYCVGGPMCPTLQIPFGRKINVLIMPEGVVAPAVNNGQEEVFYPVLCFGKTGAQGCSKSIAGHRLKSSNQSGWQWSVDNYFYKPYGKSLPGVYEFEIPSAWMPSAGTYDFTAYINYNQQVFPEYYGNNLITFSVTVEGDPSINKAPAFQTPPSNLYYFDNTLVVLQDGNCVQGCAVTTNGAVNASLPVEIYVRSLKLFAQNTYAYVSDPVAAAMFACKGATSQNGCANPFPVDAPPYSIPQWFLDGPDAALLNDPYKPLVRFTIPGEQISTPGIYKFTFYVNYLQQSALETIMNDNIKTIYLQVVPSQ